MTPEEVAKVRKETADRTKPYTLEELLKPGGTLAAAGGTGGTGGK